MNAQYFHLNIPTTIGTYQLGATKEMLDQWAQKAYELTKNSNKTNVKAQMSSYQVFDETDEYNELIKRIDKLINLNNDKLKKLSPNYEYKTQAAWTAVYREKDYTQKHRHSITHLSYVYYIKANNQSSPIIFNEANFSITPQDDLLVVFDSHLLHEVPPCTGEDRICLAGNLIMEYKTW